MARVSARGDGERNPGDLSVLETRHPSRSRTTSTSSRTRSLTGAGFLLERNGEFFPFAFRLPREGGPEMVAADHGGDEALTVLLPYRSRGLRRTLEFGDLAALPGERRVWR